MDPLIEDVPAGTRLVRVHGRAWGPEGFNPTEASGRFRPVRTRAGVVPTAYLGSDEETALAEGLLRGVSALRGGAPRRLFRVEVDQLDLSVVRLTRPLRVARLHGAGLTRLGLLREDLIDCEERQYPYTAEWAQALWGSRRRPHGLSWTSRQNDSGRAFMLWEPRAGGRFAPIGASLPLDQEPGLERVREACARAGVDFDG